MPQFYSTTASPYNPAKFRRSQKQRSFGFKPPWFPMPKSRQPGFQRCNHYKLNPMWRNVICSRVTGQCFTLLNFLNAMKRVFRSGLSFRYNFDEETATQTAEIAGGIFMKIVNSQMTMNGMNPTETAQYFTGLVVGNFFDGVKKNVILSRMHCILGEWSKPQPTMPRKNQPIRQY